MLYNYFVFLTHYEAQHSAQICVSGNRSDHVLLRCAHGMSKFVFADGTVFSALKVR